MHSIGLAVLLFIIFAVVVVPTAIFVKIYYAAVSPMNKKQQQSPQPTSPLQPSPPQPSKPSMRKRHSVPDEGIQKEEDDEDSDFDW